MTTFRFRALALALAAAFSSAVSAQATRSGWTMLHSGGEELHKLLYVQKGENHGDVYLRCRTGEGWVFLVHDEPEGRTASYKVTLRSGSAIEQPSFYFRYDDEDQNYYFDAAIPSNSSIFSEMSNGFTLFIDSSPYVVVNPIDQKTVHNFAVVCGAEK